MVEPAGMLPGRGDKCKTIQRLDVLWRWCATSAPAAPGTGRRPGKRCGPTWSRRCWSWTTPSADGDADAIRGELSDLLLHLAFQLVIAEERGEFTADEVADELEAKMRRRHPHLFDLGDGRAVGADQAAGAAGTDAGGHRRRRCRRCSGPSGCRSAPRRSDSTGPTWRGPLAKVREELAEVESELAVAPGRVAERQPADPNTPRHAAERRADRRDRRPALRGGESGAEGRRQPGTALDRANRKFRRAVRGGRAAGRGARDRSGGRRDWSGWTSCGTK